MSLATFIWTVLAVMCALTIFSLLGLVMLFFLGSLGHVKPSRGQVPPYRKRFYE